MRTGQTTLIGVGFINPLLLVFCLSQTCAKSLSVSIPVVGFWLVSFLFVGFVFRAFDYYNSHPYRKLRRRTVARH